jgi:hypothetical protein
MQLGRTVTNLAELITKSICLDTELYKFALETRAS